MTEPNAPTTSSPWLSTGLNLLVPGAGYAHRRLPRIAVLNALVAVTAILLAWDRRDGHYAILAVWLLPTLILFFVLRDPKLGSLRVFGTVLSIIGLAIAAIGALRNYFFAGWLADLRNAVTLGLAVWGIGVILRSICNYVATLEPIEDDPTVGDAVRDSE